jgi:hypothetical protein
MYYPKSQITTNLYTDGSEYVIIGNEDYYVGYYWKTSSGKIYTGKTPQDSNILELVKATPTSTSQNDNLLSQITFVSSADPDPGFPNYDTYSDFYNSLKGIDFDSKTLLPYYLPNVPTDKDYQIGEFRRYFCKKINEIIYIEIDKKQFDLLKNKSIKIAYEFYQPFDIPWRLTGDKTFVNNVNFNMVQLAMFKQKLPQFNRYIKDDYTKYYK